MSKAIQTLAMVRNQCEINATILHRRGTEPYASYKALNFSARTGAQYKYQVQNIHNTSKVIKCFSTPFQREAASAWAALPLPSNLVTRRISEVFGTWTLNCFHQDEKLHPDGKRTLNNLIGGLESWGLDSSHRFRIWWRMHLSWGSNVWVSRVWEPRISDVELHAPVLGV